MNDTLHAGTDVYLQKRGHIKKTGISYLFAKKVANGTGDYFVFFTEGIVGAFRHS